MVWLVATLICLFMFTCTLYKSKSKKNIEQIMTQLKYPKEQQGHTAKNHLINYFADFQISKGIKKFCFWLFRDRENVWKLKKVATELMSKSRASNFGGFFTQDYGHTTRLTRYTVWYLLRAWKKTMHLADIWGSVTSVYVKKYFSLPLYFFLT